MNTFEGFVRLTAICLHFPGRFLAALGSLAILTGTRLYLTWLVKLWVEGPIIHQDADAVTRLLLVGTALTLVMAGSVLLSEYLISDLSHRFLQRLRNAAQERLLAIGVAGVRSFHTGDLQSRVFGDIGALSRFVRDILQRLAGESLVGAGALFMMFYLDWPLALMTCVVVPAAALVLNRLTSVIRRWAATSRKGVAALTALFSEQMHGITTIKGYCTEERERLRFTRQNEAYRTQCMRFEFWSSFLVSVIWLVTGLGLLGIIAYGSHQVIQGRFTAGVLLAFCLYAGQTVEPLRKLSSIHAALQQSLAAAERVFEIIDTEPREKDGAARVPPSAVRKLEMHNVRFRYGKEKRVLEGVGFSLKSGEASALVGGSGAGKSTLAKLAVRFLAPEKGRILLNGIDVAALPLKELRRRICVVEQDPFLFSGTLEDNIRYGSPDASAEKVRWAVKHSGLDDLVDSLPRGLRAPVEESGGNLSGGQRQRIALARAIVRDPQVLILDEATSAMDGETEARILDGLKEWLARRIVLVMAHRLSTVARFRRILLLDGGRIAGEGALTRLTEECPAFRQLFEDQLRHGSTSKGNRRQ